VKRVLVRRRESSLNSCLVGIQVSHALLTESSSASGFIDGPTERPASNGSAVLPQSSGAATNEGGCS